MAKSKTLIQNPGMMLVLTYFILFTVNSLVVYLASVFLPGNVVLGTQHITTGWALIHSMGTLALVNTFAIPFIREYENRRGRMLSNLEWMVDYFLINLVGVWVLARFAEQLGFGIRSWVVALFLAIVLDLAQGMVMMQVEKYNSS